MDDIDYIDINAIHSSQKRVHAQPQGSERIQITHLCSNCNVRSLLVEPFFCFILFIDVMMVHKYASIIFLVNTNPIVANYPRIQQHLPRNKDSTLRSL
jgi:hypothetical protein